MFQEQPSAVPGPLWRNEKSRLAGIGKRQKCTPHSTASPAASSFLALTGRAPVASCCTPSRIGLAEAPHRPHTGVAMALRPQSAVWKRRRDAQVHRQDFFVGAAATPCQAATACAVCALICVRPLADDGRWGNHGLWWTVVLWSCGPRSRTSYTLHTMSYVLVLCFWLLPSEPRGALSPLDLCVVAQLSPGTKVDPSPCTACTESPVAMHAPRYAYRPAAPQPGEGGNIP